MYVPTRGVPGIDFIRFSPRGGLVCPDCGSRFVVVRRTLPWDREVSPPVRIRYHRCTDCDRRFKSVET